ncbi:MAG TPA: transporter [Lachnospiraceae bacterium]|nr:transporter [Lachnospiraceae bacterium]
MVENDRTKKAVKNITYAFLNQFLNLILTFLARTVFIRVLGAGYLGLNSIFTDVLGVLSLADLGFNTAMVYSFYKPLADNDTKKMAALTTFYKKVYRCIALVTTVTGVALCPVLPYIINLEQEVPYLYLYYFMSVANVVVSYLCVYKTSVLTADQKNYSVVRISMILNVLKTILQIFVLIVFRAYLFYLIVGIGCSFLKNYIASQKAARIYPFINQEEKLEKGVEKEIFQNIGAVFLYKISSVLLNATDNVLISLIVGTVAVGYYSNYLMIGNKLSQIYSLFFTSLIASLGNLVVREKADKRYAVFQCEQAVSYFISCIIFPCFILLANDFVRLWLGKEFVLESNTVCAIGLNLYLACIYHPLWSFREATGLYRKTKWVMLLCGVLNLVLSCVMGLRFGMFGILIASCISRILTYGWYEPRILFRDYFDREPHSFFADMFFNCLLVLFIVAVCGGITKAVVVDSWLKWVFKAGVIVLVGVAVAFAVYQKTEGFRFLWKKVEKLWKR